MNKEQTPQVRFEGFSDDWEQRKLSKFTERVRGNDERMDLPTLTMSASVGWMSQEERFSANIAGKEQKNYTLLRKGELSYNHGNSKLAKYGVVFVLKNYDEALVPRVYHSFRVTKGDSLFVEQYFASKLPDRELGKLVSSGARMDGLLNINYESFVNIKLVIPESDEQTKIGNFFKQLDNTITLQERELNLLKEQKKGFLQKMFPKNNEKVPELRFEGFNDAWEQRKLKNIANYRNGKAHEKVEDINGKFTIINSKFISVDGKVQRHTNEQVEPLFKGEIAMVLSDLPNGKALAKVFLVDKDEKYTLNQRIAGITPKENIDSTFLSYRMNRNPYFLKFDSGVSQTNLSKPEVENFEALYPKFEEQTKIGNFFKQLDNTITLQEEKLKKLKEMKKGFLQKMFV